MRTAIRDWLIVVASLSDDAAIALFVLLVLHLLGIPVSLGILVLIALVFVATTIVMHRLIIPTLHRDKISGAEAMIGLEGRVVEPLTPRGLIRVRGEYWKAISAEQDVSAGGSVEIVGVDGITLRVRPAHSSGRSGQ